MQNTLSFFTLAMQKNFSAFCMQRLQSIGLTQGLLYFIIYVGRHPYCSAGEITKALDMDWGHAHRSIERLVKDGFINKEKDKRDKRAYRLSLTEKGEIAFSVSHEIFFEWDALILSELEQEEKERLFTILEKVVHNSTAEQHGDVCCTKEEDTR